jgi:hypothetical protein
MIRAKAENTAKATGSFGRELCVFDGLFFGEQGGEVVLEDKAAFVVGVAMAAGALVTGTEVTARIVSGKLG